MSKSTKIITAKPFAVKKQMTKAVNRRMASIERKVAAQSDPIRDAFRQHMLTGKLYIR